MFIMGNLDDKPNHKTFPARVQAIIQKTKISPEFKYKAMEKNKEKTANITRTRFYKSRGCTRT